MRYQSIEKLLNTYWYSFSDEPLSVRGNYLPRLCDPVYLLPEESPDGAWHLFAHSILGLEHFVSTSGLEWKREKILFYRGHSPFIYKEGSTYYLLFEIHDKLMFSKNKDKKKDSRIMMCSSSDLYLWSEPKMIIDSTLLPLAKYKEGAVRVSRPQLVSIDGGYRLYFGSGEIKIYDTNQKTTARLMYAQSQFIDGPYEVVQNPIMGVEPDSEYRNLAVGAVHIIPCSDGFAAIECAYYFDQNKNKSTSAMLLLYSNDGIKWKLSRAIQRPSEEGWASRYITSADLRYKEDEDSWYCYYSANGYAKFLGMRYVKEGLGLFLGKDD